VTSYFVTTLSKALLGPCLEVSQTS